MWPSLDSKGGSYGEECKKRWARPHACTHNKHAHTAPPPCVGLTFLDYRGPAGPSGTRRHIPPGFLQCPSPPAVPSGVTILPPSSAAGLGQPDSATAPLQDRAALEGVFGPPSAVPTTSLCPGLLQMETAMKGPLCVDKTPTFTVGVSVAGPQVRGWGPEHRALIRIPSFPPLKPGPRL